MKPIIEVNNISKQYRLGTIGTGSMAHDLNRWWHRLRGKEDPYLRIGEANDRSTKGSSEYSWALRDISFTVQPGEVLGIIGRNGAGKSTLLKILSRITTPSTGSIKLGGRVASLLEVGTGMHPELTGRENIYLNGAILGMRKKEIDRKLEAIVDFSGVERYLDTPVKRYSSGMHVRLGFAVAAHLEPEILIVDEVLAVGDAEFQKKCLGKMKDVSSNEGRTVLFVSHNMAAVESLCTKGIVMQHGSLSFSGKTDEAIEHYLKATQVNVKKDTDIKQRTDRQGKGGIRFEYVKLMTEGKLVQVALTGKQLTIQVGYDFLAGAPLKNCRLGIGIYKQNQNFLLLSTELTAEQEVVVDKSGIFEFIIPKLPLTIGSYQITLFAESNGSIEDWVQHAAELIVEDGLFYPNGKNYPIGWAGKLVLIDHDFRFINH